MYDLLFLIGGLALLYAGGESLVRGSASLALRARVSPLVVGLTVVALGTSSPELLVSLQAAFAERDTIAVSNVIGSNICNIALILGISALIRPMKVQTQLIRLDVPIVIGGSLLMVALLYDGAVGRIEGGFLSLGLVSYVAFNLYQARKEKVEIQEALSAAIPERKRTAWVDVVMVLAGVGMLVFGADLFVDGAVALAQRLGVSSAVIGLTVVAFGTSLPELATSIVAAFRDESDLAIGNAVGSNIFNVFGILGVTALVHPLTTQGIGLIDLGVMTFVAFLLLPLIRSEYRLSRWEGALLLSVYGGYVIYLFSFLPGG